MKKSCRFCETSSSVMYIKYICRFLCWKYLKSISWKCCLFNVFQKYSQEMQFMKLPYLATMLINSLLAGNGKAASAVGTFIVLPVISCTFNSGDREDWSLGKILVFSFCCSAKTNSTEWYKLYFMVWSVLTYKVVFFQRDIFIDFSISGTAVVPDHNYHSCIVLMWSFIKSIFIFLPIFRICNHLICNKMLSKTVKNCFTESQKKIIRFYGLKFFRFYIFSMYASHENVPFQNIMKMNTSQNTMGRCRLGILLLPRAKWPNHSFSSDFILHKGLWLT